MSSRAVAPGSRTATFRRGDRIRRRADFQLAYEQGSRVQGRYGMVFVRPNGQDRARLGIATSRRLGGSVARNRAKRLIREVFRRNNTAPGYDIVVVAKRGLLDASVTAFEADYRSILDRYLRQRH